MMDMGSQEILRKAHIPSPVGENAVAPASAVPEGDGLVLLNMVAGDRGLKPRPGYKEHASGVGAGNVRSLLSYHGSDSSKDRLFATASDKIYDVSAGGAAVADHTFGTANATSGFGNAVAFVTAAGRYLAYADETNGYILYTEASDTWAAGSTTGMTPTDAVFVTQFKSRLWFVQRNSSKAWYLALGAISGGATEFDFGAVFPTGGYLVGLWSWTVDGGAGMDDLLVAVSSSGDVCVYTGTYPGATDWRQLGAWNLGGVVTGRNIALSKGGDLLLITPLGVLPLSKLVSGTADAPDTYETFKIRPRFAETVAAQKDSRGWDLILHPDNFLLVNTPGVPGEAQEQYVMSYATKGWSRFRGLTIKSMTVWRGKMYFGDDAGKVHKSEGYLDNVAQNGAVTNARSIDSFVLGAFDTMGNGQQKMVHLIRTGFVTKGVPPNVLALARYDYNTRDVVGSVQASTQAPAASLWDTGTWDGADFTDNFDTYSVTQGAEGIGSAVAIGVHLNTQAYCVLVGWDIAWEEGGIL